MSLFLSAMDDGDIVLTDSQVTSANPGAVPFEDGHDSVFHFTREEARWLLSVLPQALEAADRYAGETEPTDAELAAEELRRK